MKLTQSFLHLKRVLLSILGVKSFLILVQISGNIESPINLVSLSPEVKILP